MSSEEYFSSVIDKQRGNMSGSNDTDRKDSSMKKYTSRGSTLSAGGKVPPVEFIGGASRGLVFGIGMVAMLCLTRMFGGWEQYSGMLMDMGKYESLCADAGDLTYVDQDGRITCNIQQRAFKSLYTNYTGFELIGSIVAGLMLQSFGPKKTATVGCIIYLLHMLLLWSSLSPDSTLPLLAGIGGLGVNIVSFPACVAMEMFPGKDAMIVGLINAAQGLSGSVALVILGISQTLGLSGSSLVQMFTIFVSMPMAFLYVWSLPWGRKEDTKKDDDAKPATDSIEGLLECLFSVEFLSLVFANLIIMSMIDYLRTGISVLMGPDVQTFFFGTPSVSLITMAYTIVGALAWSAVSDIIRTPPMIVITVSIFVGSFIVSLAGPGWYQYINAALFLSIMEYTYNIKVTLATESFPNQYTGTLYGLAGALAGSKIALLSVLNAWNDITGISLVFACAGVMVIILATTLWYRQAANISYKEYNMYIALSQGSKTD